MKNYKNYLIGLLLVLILIGATLATWVYSQIDSAMPILNGKHSLYGLSSTTIVNRDEQGIPTIIADNRMDVAIATGFIHAQERFFQMDLLRRNSAGELSSLFGMVAFDYDKSIRHHRFRERARKIIKQMPSEQFKLIKSYTRGVNQGLKYLKAPPFEYLLLQQDPVEWQEEDTILTVLSMYIDLQYHDGKRERTLGAIKHALGDEVFNFLNPKGSIWDAAIDNTRFYASPLPKQHWPAAFPEKSTDKLANNAKLKTAQVEHFPGSNNWAISGQLSQTGSAIVANDMHLGIRVPNTWFRASFEYQLNGKPYKVTGLTLPGTPNMIVGSNTKIAWGFTNSYGDWSDLIVLETNEDNTQYLTPDGFINFSLHKQVIAIKGESSIEIETKETIWGPVIDINAQGQLLAYRWVAHDKEAVNLNHIKLEQVSTVDQALLVAATAGIPAQNFMVADHLGNIGWTVMGPIPQKKGEIGDIPSSWSTGENGWLGYLPVDEYPKVVNPEQQRLWTANSRVVGGEMYKKLGNGGYAIGARSSQIRDGLLAKNAFNEQDLLNIALDDKAVFLQRWQTFLLDQVLTPEALNTHEEWQEVKQLLDEKTLHASKDSVAYRLVRNFRLNLRDNVFSLMNKQLTADNSAYDFHTIRHQVETPLWQLITEKPDTFTLPNNHDWQSLFYQALTETLAEMTDGQSLSAATWGQQNTMEIQHPLSNSVPFIGKWLDMPNTPLAGDSYMPRVQGTTFGASERMIVSPGHEESGILHMPTSQSSHPWSPYYGKGHSDWEQGKASPFLPGKTIYTLTLLSY